MDVTRLVAEVESPSLHRALLGGFEGPYSLGVGRDESSSKAVLLLMVPPDVPDSFPTQVDIAGESVPVVVQRDFKVPVPLNSRQQETSDA
jgi:hypothetical protein